MFFSPSHLHVWPVMNTLQPTKTAMEERVYLANGYCRASLRSPATKVYAPFSVKPHSRPYVYQCFSRSGSGGLSTASITLLSPTLQHLTPFHCCPHSPPTNPSPGMQHATPNVIEAELDDFSHHLKISNLPRLYQAPAVKPSQTQPAAPVCPAPHQPLCISGSHQCLFDYWKE